MTKLQLANLRAPAKWKARERVLFDDELRAVWIAADATPGSFTIIVKLLILTGQRRGEIAALKAEWCSLSGVVGASTTSDKSTSDCEVSSALEMQKGSTAGCGDGHHDTALIPLTMTNTQELSNK